MSERVGLIGLGAIGLPLAANFIAKGFEVHGYRRSPMHEFQSIGGRPAVSPRAIAEACNVIVTVLPPRGGAGGGLGAASDLERYDHFPRLSLLQPRLARWSGRDTMSSRSSCSRRVGPIATAAPLGSSCAIAHVNALAVERFKDSR